MSKKEENTLTKHHIIPTSRAGKDYEENISYVPKRQHELYHSLFNNRTPQEIVEYLNRDFWNNQYTGIEKKASIHIREIPIDTTRYYEENFDR